MLSLALWNKDFTAIDRRGERDRQTETDKQTEGERGGEREGDIDRQREREGGRQRQSETHRETDRGRETHRERTFSYSSGSLPAALGLPTAFGDASLDPLQRKFTTTGYSVQFVWPSLSLYL